MSDKFIAQPKLWSNIFPTHLYRTFDQKKSAEKFYNGNFRIKNIYEDRSVPSPRGDIDEGQYKNRKGATTEMASPRFTLCFSGPNTDLKHMIDSFGGHIVCINNVSHFLDCLRDYFSSGIPIKVHGQQILIFDKPMEIKKKLPIEFNGFRCLIPVLAIEFLSISYSEFSPKENNISSAKNCYGLKKGKYKNDNEWRIVVHLDRARVEPKGTNIDDLLPYVSYLPVNIESRVIDKEILEIKKHWK